MERPKIDIKAVLLFKEDVELCRRRFFKKYLLRIPCNPSTDFSGYLINNLENMD
jgi:hypothetical protein